MRNEHPSYDGSLAAIGFSAGLVVLLARILPVEFAYRPNDLGIVSVVSRLGYPKQQEIFWLCFGVGVGAVSIVVLARALRALRPTAATVVRLESCGAAALLAVLFLPGWVGLAVFAAAAAGALWLRQRSSGGAGDAIGAAAAESPISIASVPMASTAIASIPMASTAMASVLWWLPAMIALALVLTPSIPIHISNVARAVPDAKLAHDHFKFLAETGQHLAWANSLHHGGLHGRDFFCLYGPLYDLGIVGFWSLFGRSVAATGLYLAVIRIVAWVFLLATIALLLRRRWLLLLAPFLLPFVNLRVGFALLAFCCFVLWMRTTRGRWAFTSGLVTGVSLFFSQEYGMAFLLAAAVGFAVRRAGSAAALFVGGVACVAAPILGYFAWHGALGPMLRDILSYPGYVIAGYANLPYFALLEALPLEFRELASRGSAGLRLGYAIPLVCVAGIVLASGILQWDWRHPVASLRGIIARLAGEPERLAVLTLALFSLIAFRSALGRSDLSHLQAAMPGVVVLLCIAADRSLAAWSGGGPGRRVMFARLAWLAGFLALGGFVQTATPLKELPQAFHTAARLLRAGHHPVGSRRIERAVHWVQENTRPGEPVLFLPNDAAYYYLTDRPNPIRFVLGHQIVGDAHRREVLADLVANPPRYVVWDHAALVVDEIPHDVVFGAEITRFLAENYELETRLGKFDILRRVGAPSG